MGQWVARPGSGRQRLPSGGLDTVSLGVKPPAPGPPCLLRVSRPGPAPEADVGARAVRRQRLQVMAKCKGSRGCLASRPHPLDLCQSGAPSLVNRGLTQSLSQKSRELCAQTLSPLTKGCDLHIFPKTRARPGVRLRYPALALSRSWGPFLSKRWASRPLCPVNVARAVWAEMSFSGQRLYTERVTERSGTGQGVGGF